MNPLMAYFWPSFVAGVVIGAIVLTLIVRKWREGFRKWLVIDLGVFTATVASLLWSGPLGGGRRFIDAVEPLARSTLDYYEMTQVTARLGSGPLTRQLLLEGPANDLQRSELVRLMGQIPGVSNAAWSGGNGAIPIIVEGALVACAGFLLGMLLAYLLESHRRYNAQWSW
ncbi:MAG: hypothetical protein ABIS23_03410 [Sphingomicrobium sp.]